VTTTRRHQRACAAAAVALIAFGAAACGGEEGNGDSDPLSSQTTGGIDAPASLPFPASSESAAEGAIAIATGKQDKLGEYLTDGAGMVLYVYTNDTGAESTCYDQCAALWPPLVTDTEDVAVGGAADAALTGTTERTDGTVQVTYKGHPLYYYGEDDEPGEAGGQGVNGVWFVVKPDGSATTKEEEPTSKGEATTEGG
jgi:predicted lipoprotein with Yx(FWY)xxD motif